MTNINKEGLFSSIVPEVYIDSITLETSGNRPFKQDPHIDDHDLETRKVTTTEDKTLSVKIDISVKETLNNDLLGSWFSEQDFNKYLKIKVVQSKNKSVTKLLTSSNVISNMASSRGFLDGVSDESVNNSIEEAMTRGTLGALISNNTSQKDISLSEITTPGTSSGDLTSLVRTPATIYDDGTKVYNFNFRVSYELTDSSPQDLAYFVLSYIDTDSLLEDYSLPRSPFIKRQNGKLTSEIVFQDGELKSTSQVFKDPDNRIWTGKIGISDTVKGPMYSYVDRTGKTILLNLTEVQNHKVHDYRILQFLDRADSEEDAQAIDSFLLSLSPKDQFGNIPDMIRKEKDNTYFSKLSVTATPDSVSRFLFTVDMGKILSNNSVYGNLFRRLDNVTKEKVLSKSSIKSIKIFRTRVRPSKQISSAGALIDKNVPQDQSLYPSKMIASIAGKSKSFTSSTASLRESSLAMFRNSKSLKTYSGADFEMSNLTDGKYSYSVEIEVFDGMKVYLSDLLSDLISKKKLLKSYLSDAEKPGMTKTLLRVSNPHIDYEGEASAALNSSAVQDNVDQITGRFSNSFNKHMLKKYPDTKMQPWKEPVATFIEAHSLMKEEKSINTIATSIFSMISPATGNVDALSSFVDLQSSVIKKMSLILGSSAPFGKTGVFPQKTAVDSKRTVGNIVIRADFDSVIDSNKIKKLGYDYISATGVDIDKSFGLSSLNLESWTNRVSVENERWLASDVSSMSIKPNTGTVFVKPVSDNDYSFLCPSMIYTSPQGNPTENDPRSLSVGEYSSLYAKISAYNIQGRYTTLPENNEAIEYSSTLTDSLALLGASFVELESEEVLTGKLYNIYSSQGQPSKTKGIVTESYEKVDLLIESNKEKLHKTSKIDRNAFAKNAFLRDYYSGSKDRKDISLDDYNVNSPGARIKDFSAGELNMLPNQILSIIASAESPDVSAVNFFSFEEDAVKNPRYSSIYDLTISCLGRVEFLSEYTDPSIARASSIPGKKRLPEQEINVMKEKWETLTREKVESLYGEYIFCRITPYSSEKLLISSSDDAKLPLYNNFFLIKLGNRAIKIPPGLSDKISSRLGDLWTELRTSSGMEFASSNPVFSTMPPAIEL